MVALIPHARAGHVRWKAAFVFGGAGLVGAFAGGRVAAFVPANGLLLGFAVLMLGTSIAMIRGRNHARVCNGTGSVAHRKHIWPMAVWGLLVGAVTGLVGAGGGFVVVPVLSLIGGLSMPVAVGTSLLVIALNSAAGFMGHWQEVSIPWTLAAAVIPASVTALVGVRLSKRLPESWLRPLFGWAVLVMSLFVLGSQIPPSLRASAVFQPLFVQRWPFWAAGAAIGTVVLALLWSENKLLGVSTGCAELCSLQRDPKLRGSWRVLFVVGIVLGGFVATTISGTHPTWNHGAFDQLFSSSLWIKAPVLIVGGVLVGFGARAAGGCTSGHGVVGMAQGARSSFLATFAFMVGGFLTTALIRMAKGVM